MTEYRLFDGVSGPGAQQSDTENYTLGVEFYVDTTCWATKLHFWASTSRTGTYTGRLYTVDTGGDSGSAVAATDVTFGSIVAGWNTAVIPGGVQLTAGQRYRAAVAFTTDNGYTVTNNYWSSGAGAAGITSGPLRAPNATDARGNRQGSFTVISSLGFPANVSSAANYWVDVTVSDANPQVVNAALYAVGAAGALTALPHFTRLAVSEVRNGIGKVEVDYPAYGLNFDLLAATTAEDRDVEVEVWLVGRQTNAVRGILTDTAGDDLTEDAVWRFEGWTLDVLLDEVLIWPQVGTDKQELVLSAAKAGTIVAALITQAQARGGLVGVTAGFTGLVDSDGAAWANVVTATFSPSATLLDVLQELIEIGMIDGFRLGPDRVLRMWNPAGQGSDLTVTNPPVIFRRGRNLTESPRRHTVRNSATTALVAGGDNLYEDADDATALARRGRRIEVAGSSNSLKDSGSVVAYAQALLTTVTPGAHEVTHGLVLGPGLPIPWRDYNVADWVWSDTRNTLDRLRIQQLELEVGPGGYAGSVVLNTAVVDRVSAIARKLKRISSGTAVVGTSVTAPETDDGKSPAQVTGVSASSAAYLANDGITWASVQAGWTAVTTNSDTSLADDIVGYFPAYRYGSGQSLPTDWQVQGQVSGTVADWSGVVAGKNIGVRVAAVDKWGHVGAWSSEYTLTSGADATPPPTPSTPVVDNYLGILTVAWDGLGSVGETQPVDFHHVDVHISTSSGFTPSSSTRVDSLRAKGTIPWDGGTYGVTYYGKLVAYDKTGNASAASAQDSVVLTQAADGDISAVSIGKLTVGIMSAIMTLSGIIRTASSGDRVEIDSDGIHCYDGSTLVFDFDLSAGTVYLRGTIEAYQSANDRIVIQPTGTGSSGGSLPEISYYAQATSPAYQNAFDAGTGRTGLGINSGNSADSGTSRRQTTLQLRPDRFILFYNTAPGDASGTSARRGAEVGGSSSQASMNLYNSSANLVGAIEIDTEIVAEWHGGTGAIDGGYLRLRPNGSDTFLGHFDSAGADSYLSFGGGDGNIILHRGSTQDLTMTSTQTELRFSSTCRVLFTGSEARIGAGNNTFITLSNGGNIGFFEGGTGYASLSALKSFVIDHPLDDDRLLVHVCTESPTAGVEYTGHVEIVDGRAEVELPRYFEALCEEAGRTVQLTPVGVLCRVASQPVAAGRFVVLSDAPDGTRVDWHVRATRRNAAFDVEPLRAGVNVAGSGPYRWISPEPVLVTADADTPRNSSQARPVTRRATRRPDPSHD